MSRLCQYKYSLGVPKKGMHEHLLNVAVMDVLFTLLFVWFLVNKFNFDFSLTASIVFFLGFLLHYLFCINN